MRNNSTTVELNIQLKLLTERTANTQKASEVTASEMLTLAS